MRVTTPSSDGLFSSDWMDIPNYLADYGLESLPAALLSKVCSRLKLSGHSKLDHQHRAEMFLRHMERPEQRIKEAVEFLASKKKEREKPKEDEEDSCLHPTMMYFGLNVNYCRNHFQRARKMIRGFYFAYLYFNRFQHVRSQQCFHSR